MMLGMEGRGSSAKHAGKKLLCLDEGLQAKLG